MNNFFTGFGSALILIGIALFIIKKFIDQPYDRVD